jgi:hypothetical protein
MLKLLRASMSIFPATVGIGIVVSSVEGVYIVQGTCSHSAPPAGCQQQGHYANRCPEQDKQPPILPTPTITPTSHTHAVPKEQQPIEVYCCNTLLLFGLLQAVMEVLTLLTAPARIVPLLLAANSRAITQTGAQKWVSNLRYCCNNPYSYQPHRGSS